MKKEKTLKDWRLNDGASEEVLHDLVRSLEHPLPPDYLQFLRRQDGGEGFIGANYLILWKAEELISFNREYEVNRHAPGLLLFGSNGGGEGYGFDLRETDMPIVRVPFIGMDLQYATPVAKDFNDLFVQLEK